MNSNSNLNKRINQLTNQVNDLQKRVKTLEINNHKSSKLNSIQIYKLCCYVLVVITIGLFFWWLG